MLDVDPEQLSDLGQENISQKKQPAITVVEQGAETLSAFYFSFLRYMGKDVFTQTMKQYRKMLCFKYLYSFTVAALGNRAFACNLATKFEGTTTDQ